MTAPAVHRSPRAQAPWRVVARHEIAVKMRDKAFIILTVAMLALMAGSMTFAVYMGQTRDTVEVAVAGDDAAQVVAAADAAADAAGAHLDYEAVRVPDAGRIRDDVRSKTAGFGLVHEGSSWTVVSLDEPETGKLQWLQTAVSQTAVAGNAASQGVDLAKLQQGAELKQDVLGGTGISPTAAMFITMGFGMLFYVAAMLLGSSLASSIVEEKQNRVVEVVASSTPVRDLLIGKVVAATVLGTGQMALIAAVAVAGMAATGRTHLLTSVGPGIGWFLVFFLVGIAVLATLFAATAALASRTEDTNSVTMPVTMLAALAFMAGFMSRGAVGKAVSFVPLASTAAMPGRLIMGEAEWWEPLVALALDVAAAWVLVKVGERIYTRALLQTSGRLGIKQAWHAGDPRG